MFDGIVMDVFDILTQISFVANLMFPKSPLPNG
jgi:hypothetical protein